MIFHKSTQVKLLSFDSVCFLKYLFKVVAVVVTDFWTLVTSIFLRNSNLYTKYMWELCEQSCLTFIWSYNAIKRDLSSSGYTEKNTSSPDLQKQTVFSNIIHGITIWPLCSLQSLKYSLGTNETKLSTFLLYQKYCSNENSLHIKSELAAYCNISICLSRLSLSSVYSLIISRSLQSKINTIFFPFQGTICT